MCKQDGHEKALGHGMPTGRNKTRLNKAQAVEDAVDAKGARVGRRAVCRLMNTPTRKSESIHLSVRDTQPDNGWEKEGREHAGLAFSAQKDRGNRVTPNKLVFPSSKQICSKL